MDLRQANIVTKLINVSRCWRILEAYTQIFFITMCLANNNKKKTDFWLVFSVLVSEQNKFKLFRRNYSQDLC